MRYFELTLLSGMTNCDYKESLLNNLNITDNEILNKYASQSPIQLREGVNVGADIFASVLGEPAKKKQKTSNDGDTIFSHCFQLALWPHLFWVVDQSEGELNSGVRFENQTTISKESLYPEFLYPGVITKKSLMDVADEYTIVDGWDEDQVWSFVIRGREYKAIFYFDLFIAWE